MFHAKNVYKSTAYDIVALICETIITLVFMYWLLFT